MGTTAEWVAAAVAGLGVVVAVAALFVARKANVVAQQAVEKADAANELSGDANAISREANRIAVDGNKLAEQANAAAEAAGARETERGDVSWELDWQGYGHLAVTNVGQDAAHDIRAVVTVDDHEVDKRAQGLATGGSLALDFQSVADQRRDEIRRAEADRAWEEANREADPFGLAYPDPRPLYRPAEMLFCSYRITWRTELGKPCADEGKLFFGADDPLG